VNRVWAYESSPGEHVLQRLLLVLIFCGLLFGALGGWLYFSVNEQATRAQMTSARDHYGKVLADLERRWGVEAFNFKRRLESQSFLERAPLQQERLNAYLAAQGGSIEFPMLRIEDLKGGTVAAYDLLGRQMPRVTFLSGQETAWAIEPVDGRLFLVFRQLIWLGKENGYLFLYKPMDHALLTEHSYPFTRISLWWMGQPVASSDGDDGLADAASSLAQSGGRVSTDRLSWPGVTGDPSPVLLIEPTSPPLILVRQLLVPLLLLWFALAIGIWTILGNWRRSRL
jgi:hypothetical protein